MNTVATTQTITPPAPGQYWPGQGGVYIGICRGEAGQPARHIIVATAPEAAFRGSWGKYGKDVAGAKHRFDGRTNTAAMAAAGSEIAQRVLALQIDGHQDFHIGSQAEMALASANAPELFEPGYHWSSTQISRCNAFVQGFEYGDSTWGDKGGEHRVRAFRGLPLEPLSTLAEGPGAKMLSELVAALRAAQLPLEIFSEQYPDFLKEYDTVAAAIANATGGAA